MSIILKGIDLPEKFESASLTLERIERYGTIRVINESSGEYIGHAIQIPTPHGRLIDGDELKSIKSIQSADFNSIETIQKWIDNAPTILESEE